MWSSVCREGFRATRRRIEMHTRSFVLIVASALLLACSSGSGSGTGFGSGNQAGGSGSGSGSGSGGSGSSSGTSGPTSSGGSGGGGSTGSSSSSSSGGSDDGGQAVPPSDSGGAQLTLDGTIPAADFGDTQVLTATPFSVAAGAEVYKCQKFANPFGAAVDLLQMHGT